MAEKVVELSSLKGKQKLFVDEYLVDLNATQAAIRAGYSEKTAEVIGHENLRKPKIAAAIEKAMAERSERTKIKGDDVIKSIASIGFSNIKHCVAVLYGDATIADLTDEQAAAIESATVETYLEGKGDEARAVKRVHIKFKPSLPALIQLGKHLGLPGFLGDKVEQQPIVEQPSNLLAYEDPLREESMRAFERAVTEKRLQAKG